ncbi:hypothetical protein J4434_03310 [Candidatus Woesearchaeota archaeon]|nr:hypothetical protein [Candidatus Woesearchaeota archaeon]
MAQTLDEKLEQTNNADSTNLIASPLVYTYTDGKHGFVHDTYRDFFLAKWFADEINEGRMIVRNAYINYWISAEETLDGMMRLDVDKWASKFTFFPWMLAIESAEAFVGLLFDSFFGSYSRMFMYVRPEKLKAKGGFNEKERDFRDNPFIGFEKWGNLRELIDHYYNVDYHFKNKQVDYLKAIADLTAKFVYVYFLKNCKIASEFTNMLVLIDYPTIIDFSILAKMECLNTGKTMQLVEYKAKKLDEAREKQLREAEETSAEEDENLAKRWAYRYGHDAAKIRLLKGVITKEPTFSQRSFTIKNDEYWSIKCRKLGNRVYGQGGYLIS